MFPFARLAKDWFLASRLPPIGVGETHVSHHMCWPWDLDIWAELNNGRALTLYDLGRMGVGQRAGLVRTLVAQKWGLTMAGVTVRFRRRIRVFDRFKVKSRVVCWDDKFMYLEQSMWKSDGDCASHVLYRVAVTDADGLVRTDRVVEALGVDPVSPPVPEWIAAWIVAEAQRPWPPMQAPVLKAAE